MSVVEMDMCATNGFWTTLMDDTVSGDVPMISDVPPLPFIGMVVPTLLETETSVATGAATMKNYEGDGSHGEDNV